VSLVNACGLKRGGLAFFGIGVGVNKEGQDRFWPERSAFLKLSVLDLFLWIAIFVKVYAISSI